MFSVGDEVVCINDEPYWVDVNGERNLIDIGIKKGAAFTVIGAFPAGYKNGQFVLTNDCIQIGRPNPANEYVRVISVFLMASMDIWVADRFRKVERKRTREELYALIGISAGQNGTVRVLETQDA